MKKVKIKGKFVIGHDGKEHVIYRDGEIVYKGNKIIYVGHEYSGEVDEVINTGLSIISPGFIDLEADIDTDHMLTDRATPAKKNEPFIMGNKFRTIDPYTDEDFRIRHEYSIAQLIRNGVTTAMPIEGETFHGWSQSYREHEIMAEVGLEMGMRLYVGPSFKSFKNVGEGYDETRSENSFYDAIRHFEKFDGMGNGLIKGFINPCQIRVTTEDIIIRAMEFAKKKNAPMRLHACEGIHEWDYIKKLGGNTTIEYFNKLGILNENLIIPHGTAMTDNEISLLASNGVSVVTTPFVEIGSSLNSFSKYQHYGINMTIGTDAQPLDMIRNMRMAYEIDIVCQNKTVFRVYNGDGSVTNPLDHLPSYPQLSFADYYNAATVNPAKALKRTDIGRLVEGAKADIIVINLNDISVGPYEDPIRTLLLNCTGSSVSHTIIDGQILMKDKKLTKIDEESLMKKAQIVYEKFLKLYEEYDKYGRSYQLMHSSTFKYI